MPKQSGKRVSLPPSWPFCRKKRAPTAPSKRMYRRSRYPSLSLSSEALLGLTWKSSCMTCAVSCTPTRHLTLRSQRKTPSRISSRQLAFLASPTWWCSLRRKTAITCALLRTLRVQPWLLKSMNLVWRVTLWSSFKTRRNKLKFFQRHSNLRLC